MTPTLQFCAQSCGMSGWAIVAHRRHLPTFRASNSNPTVFPESFMRIRIDWRAVAIKRDTGDRFAEKKQMGRWGDGWVIRTEYAC